MFNFYLSLKNPWSDAEYDLLYSAHKRVSENKSLEFSLSHSDTLWGIGISLTHRTDHAGLTLSGSFLGRGFELNLCDNRHWDRALGNWQR